MPVGLARLPAALVAPVAVFVAAAAAALEGSVVEFVFPATSSAAAAFACFAVCVGLESIAGLGTGKVLVAVQTEVAGAAAAARMMACGHSVFLHQGGVLHKALAQQLLALFHQLPMQRAIDGAADYFYLHLLHDRSSLRGHRCDDCTWCASANLRCCNLCIATIPAVQLHLLTHQAEATTKSITKWNWRKKSARRLHGTHTSTDA